MIYIIVFLMKRGSLDVLEAISTNADLINSLRGGAKHPTELAKEFDISRVAIDRRLKRLKRLGLVDPKPCLSKNSDRTIVKYELSDGCMNLIKSIDNDVEAFYNQKLRDLDILLATRKVDEDHYLEKKEKLENQIKKVKKRF